MLKRVGHRVLVVCCPGKMGTYSLIHSHSHSLTPSLARSLALRKTKYSEKCQIKNINSHNLVGKIPHFSNIPLASLHKVPLPQQCNSFHPSIYPYLSNRTTLRLLKSGIHCVRQSSSSTIRGLRLYHAVAESLQVTSENVPIQSQINLLKRTPSLKCLMTLSVTSAMLSDTCQSGWVWEGRGRSK